MPTQVDEYQQSRRFFSYSSQLTMSGQEDQLRPPARRGASGAWNRLRPVQQDPLQAYGLPSKGETRLNDFKTQESFYNRIVERYLKFCAVSNQENDLDRQFSSLSLESLPPTGLLASKWATRTPAQSQADSTKATPSSQEPSTTPNPSTDSIASKASSTELQSIIGAMRKLREGIVASRRTDTFAQRAYIFIIRATILVRSWEAYQPALLYLLQHIHPRSPLAAPDLHEFAAYHVLDLACRQRDLNLALTTKYRYRLKEQRLDAIVRSLIRDDWMLFWRVKRKVDGYQRALLGFAEDAMRLHALKCIGRSYFSAQKAWIERVMDKTWEELVESGVGWEREGEKIIIRRPKAK